MASGTIGTTASSGGCMGVLPEKGKVSPYKRATEHRGNSSTGPLKACMVQERKATD